MSERRMDLQDERQNRQDDRQNRQDNRADRSEDGALIETRRQDAEHARQDALFEEDHRRLEHAMRWFQWRWIQPILLIVLALGLLYVGIAGQERQTELTASQVSLAIIQAFDQTQAQTNHQQSLIFNKFLGAFVAEQDYLCRIAASRAVLDHLETPPPGICNVTLKP